MFGGAGEGEGGVGAGLGQEGGQEGAEEGEEVGLHLHHLPLLGDEGAGGGLHGDAPKEGQEGGGAPHHLGQGCSLRFRSLKLGFMCPSLPKRKSCFKEIASSKSNF